MPFRVPAKGQGSTPTPIRVVGQRRASPWAFGPKLALGRIPPRMVQRQIEGRAKTQPPKGHSARIAPCLNASQFWHCLPSNCSIQSCFQVQQRSRTNCAYPTGRLSRAHSERLLLVRFCKAGAVRCKMSAISASELSVNRQTEFPWLAPLGERSRRELVGGLCARARTALNPQWF